MHHPETKTCEVILEVSGELFSQCGYTTVRLRDIADAVGLRHASLALLCPGRQRAVLYQSI
jgi:hypothetical protein